MDYLRLWFTLTVLSAAVGLVGAVVGTVPLMWLVALVHEHVYAGIRPAGYGDLFLIDWILSYWTVAFMLGIKHLLEDS